MSSTPNPQPATGATVATGSSAADQPRRTRKVGIVVSNKMEKTVVVEVSRTVRHERYGRYQKKSARFLADDRVLKAQPGDTVQIEETRPLSARKRWRVITIVTKGRQAVSDTADVPGSEKKVTPRAVPDKKLAGKPAKRAS
ncbi:MAG: 30S ribosomal protein S17 [Thermoanaerobaculia bacterium]|nr:30S ribosomal protein S17 [Thermoanaerobaculia bacterium]